ncbi:LytR/AlgR family response regulator transcription factor [Streptomyces sp. NPDC048297]|uniref:LytR/AlgR family response regulator transcription factor n=1 Tax=Streptomyces sp. NPDC048297 TaxID=3365531 RepID=UPI0037226130
MGEWSVADAEHRARTAKRADGATGLRVLAVDDEQPALEELLYLLGRDARVGRVEGARGATEALRRLGQAMGDGESGDAGIDVVFLDINMPGLSGLDMAKLLTGFAAPPLIVFVTAHEDFAVQAFDLKAVDYLLKPIRQERFSEAVRRVAEAITAGPAPHSAPTPAGAAASAASATSATSATSADTTDRHDRAAAPATESEVSHVPVELGGVTRFVDIDDISHVEAHGDYARVHTRQGVSHLIRTPLATLEESWRSRGFVRIHRRYLVRLASIEELRLNGGNLTVRTGDQILAVSRRNARELRDLLARQANGGSRGAR